MEFKQPFKIRYLVVVFLAFIIALTFHYGQTFKDAIYSEGFPVPGKAKVLQTSSEIRFESYSWKPASEENGLPIRYKLMISLSGWKKTDRMGALTAYEKDGRKVDIISQNSYLGIHGQKE